MGVIRAGVVTLRLVEKPDHPDVGAKWSFENGRQTLDYCVTARTSGGELRIARLDGTGETITARLVCDRLDVTEIKLPVAVASQEGLALRFDGSGGFQLSVEEAKSAVIGRAAVTESSDLSIIETFSRAAELGPWESCAHRMFQRRRFVQICVNDRLIHASSGKRTIERTDLNVGVGNSSDQQFRNGL